MSRITTDLFETYKEMATGKVLNEDTDSIDEAYYTRRPSYRSPFQRAKEYDEGPVRGSGGKISRIPDSVIQRMDAARKKAEEEEKRKSEQQKTEGVQKADENIAEMIEQGMMEKETITMEFVIENTFEVSVPSTVTYQDYLNAINTIVNSEDPTIQAEIVSIANEAFNNNNIEVIAEAELIKQGIIEAGYKATRMGDKQFSPELNLDIDRTEPGVTKVSRRIRSGEGKGITATERRTMKRIASRTK